MEVVDNLGEALGRLLLARLVQDVDLDGPFFHREALDLRRLGARLPLVLRAAIHSSHSIGDGAREDGGNAHVVLLGDELDPALYPSNG